MKVGKLKLMCDISVALLHKMGIGLSVTSNIDNVKRVCTVDFNVSSIEETWY